MIWRDCAMDLYKHNRFTIDEIPTVGRARILAGADDGHMHLPRAGTR